MRLILTVFMLTGFASAQNSDFSFLSGIAGPRGKISLANGATSASGSDTTSFQFNYAWQVLQRKADLYVEMPLLILDREDISVTSSSASTSVTRTSSPDVLFTPGVRIKISPEARVSFYAAAGIGIASFGGTSTVALPLTVDSGHRETSFAFGFGGGVDFRLTRLLSLRVESRDFVTRSGLGGVRGHNHATLQFGLAFHF